MTDAAYKVLGGEAHFTEGALDAVSEERVEEDSWYGHDKAHVGGDKRLRDSAGEVGGVGVRLGCDDLEGFDHADYGSEETKHGRNITDESDIADLLE